MPMGEYGAARDGTTVVAGKATTKQRISAPTSGFENTQPRMVSAKRNLNQSSSVQFVENSGAGGPRRAVRAGTLSPSIEASVPAVVGTVAREFKLGRGAGVGPCAATRCS